MVQAGAGTDATIDSLVPHLAEGDIIIDGGNAYFPDTLRRSKDLEAKGFRFIGTGVSGGEEGALKGPSIMPGGQKSAYELVEPILTAISAKVGDDACCTYIGPDGAGHYVKMVHNGIEYGDMQLICEAYDLLKNVLDVSAEELHEIFSEWNKGELDSYLIEITRDIFSKYDPETGKPMVDVILDSAGQKGTGKWTSQSALDLGVPLSIITESVFSRFLSAMKEERVAASKVLNGPAKTPFQGDKAAFIEAVRKALFASKICSYAQGFAQMRAASEEYNWDLNYGEIAMIFRGGCIIRARFLQNIKDAYDRDPDLRNLLLDPYFQNIVESYQGAWREVIAASCYKRSSGSCIRKRDRLLRQLPYRAFACEPAASATRLLRRTHVQTFGQRRHLSTSTGCNLNSGSRLEHRLAGIVLIQSKGCLTQPIAKPICLLSAVMSAMNERHGCFGKEKKVLH